MPHQFCTVQDEGRLRIVTLEVSKDHQRSARGRE